MAKYVIAQLEVGDPEFRSFVETARKIDNSVLVNGIGKGYINPKVLKIETTKTKIGARGVWRNIQRYSIKGVSNLYPADIKFYWE